MKELTLTNRLVLLLMLPLAGVVAFGGWGAREKWRIAQEYLRARASNSVLGQICSLVHELQKERGRSAVFVGSKGTKFAEELSAPQAATDANLASFASRPDRLRRGRFWP